MSWDFLYGIIAGTISGVVGTVLAWLIQSGLNHYWDKVRLKPTLSWTIDRDGSYVLLSLACDSHRKARIRSVDVVIKVAKIAASNSKGKFSDVDSPTFNFHFIPIDASDNVEMERDQCTEYQLMFNETLYSLIVDSKPQNVSLEAKLMNGTIIRLGKGKDIQLAFKHALMISAKQKADKDNPTDLMSRQ